MSNFRPSISWLRHAFAALGFSTLAACGGGGGHSPSLDRIEVTPASPSAPLGTTQQFKATAIFSDNSSEDVTTTVTWASAAPSVATIDNTAGSNGLAHTVAVGTTSISAQLDDKTAAVTFTVTDAAPTAVQVTPGATSLAKGTTAQLVATATFTDGTSRSVTADATWSSGAPSVVTVSDTAPTKGLVMAATTGAAAITAIYEGKSGSGNVTVTAATVQSLAVTPPTPSIPKGTTQQFAVTATLSDGTTQDVTSQATWSSGNTGVVSVSDSTGSKGLAKGLGVGTSQISASFSGKSAAATLTVTAAVLQSIAVSPASASVANGLSQQYMATGSYSDASTKDLTTSVTWSSSAANVATISNASGSNGLAQSAGVGSASIRAVDSSGSGITGEATLTVTDATLVSLDVSPTNPAIPTGNSEQFTATGIYTDSSRKDLTQSATWTSSDTSVSDVSNASGNRGLALGKAAGNTTIGASFGGKSASTSLTVTSATLTVIQVTPTNSKLAATYTRQYAATGIYSDNSTRDITQTVTWSTSAPATATVSNATGSKGVVTGVAAGAVNIVAAQDGISGNTPLTVSNATLSSVAVTPANPSIALGNKQQFVATGTFSDSTTQDLTTQVSWTSATATVATISNDAGTQGLATSVGTGSSTITATIKSVSGTTRLTVTAATLTKISVTPNPATVAKGATLALTATGTYSDNTTQDITTDVTWTSSNTAVATITNGGSFGSGTYGVVTGVAEGSVTISAALGGITGTGPLTVSSKALTSIAVTPANKSVAKGVTVQYTATGTYTDSTTADVTKMVTWTSSSEAVATVSNASGSNGLASTPGTGTATISAAQDGVTGTTGITVTAKTLSSVAVTPATPSIPNGTNQQFTATGSYSDGTTADLTGSVTWSSATTAVATISNADGTRGLASSVAAGSSVIKAVSGTQNGTATLTVTAAALQRITVTPASGSVAVGYFLQYTATGSYADGSTKDITAEVSWSTFNDAIANVSNASGSKGQVTGATAGSTTILASLSSISASASVTVTNATLMSIAVTPANATIAGGATLQYTATGTFSDSSKIDLTKQVVWASSNSGTATIDQTGLATAGTSALTTSTISATHGSGTTAVAGSTSLTRSLM